ncbi:MAG TPA: ribosome biogenesis GTPase Der [Vicinamibacterales bacterium]|jgi:GTP-binding protein|nr:ribosome biogenesis GTPase Der [Vicinamibacterales bacterium]
MARKIPSVVLVGRPNVGKSTLFNRITGSRRAIVAPLAGTTRDSLARPAVWRGIAFQLSDTGGLYGASQDPLHELVVRQGHRAIVGADLLVLVVDGREGLVPGDQTIARELREADRPVILAINKSDDNRARHATMDFYALGIDPVVEISAEHGQGVADLLDEIVARLGDGIRDSGFGTRPADGGFEGEPNPESKTNPKSQIPSPESDELPEAIPPDPEVAVAVVGRPNVGKSSLVNRLLNAERVLVSDMPGTTRDAIDAVLTWHRRRFRIVDTAGMRKPGRVARGGQVEFVSVAGSKRAIMEADVVALVLDASTGPTDHDAAIGGEADRAGRGVVIIANKWDLVKERGPTFSDAFDDETRRHMRFLDYAPILHISALTGERTPKILETIDRIHETRRKRVPTPALNKFLEAVTAANPPVSPGNKHVRILYAAQIGVAPPSFVFFTNVATTFHFSYERFLTNQLREHFGFVGTPIRIQVRRRDRKVAGQRTASKNRKSGQMAKSQRQRSDRHERAGRKDRHGRRRPQK